jgi:hypothetical protein
MKLGQDASVRWLKGFYGFDHPDPARPNVVAVNPRAPGAGNALAEMGRDLGGSRHALAVYITLNADRTTYWDGRSKLGSVAGLLWLEELPCNSVLMSHKEDDRYKEGWPIVNALERTGPPLAALLTRTYGPGAHDIERRLRSYFQRSVPIPIYALFPELADALTEFYRK